MERSDNHLGYYLLENEEVRPCTFFCSSPCNRGDVSR